jgi:hypothetical protein
VHAKYGCSGEMNLDVDVGYRKYQVHTCKSLRLNKRPPLPFWYPDVNRLYLETNTSAWHAPVQGCTTLIVSDTISLSARLPPRRLYRRRQMRPGSLRVAAGSLSVPHFSIVLAPRVITS